MQITVTHLTRPTACPETAFHCFPVSPWLGRQFMPPLHTHTRLPACPCLSGKASHAFTSLPAMPEEMPPSPSPKCGMEEGSCLFQRPCFSCMRLQAGCVGAQAEFLLLLQLFQCLPVSGSAAQSKFWVKSSPSPSS